MNKENHKKLSLEDLLARAEQREQGKTVFKRVYVDSLGGDLELQRIPLSRMLSMLDGVDGSSMQENLDFQTAIIYQCCPVLRNPALLEAFQCDTQTEVVCAVFEDNMGAISGLAEEILGFYGLADHKDTVKN